MNYNFWLMVAFFWWHPNPTCSLRKFNDCSSACQRLCSTLNLPPQNQCPNQPANTCKLQCAFPNQYQLPNGCCVAAENEVCQLSTQVGLLQFQLQQCRNGGTGGTGTGTGGTGTGGTGGTGTGTGGTGTGGTGGTGTGTGGTGTGTGTGGTGK